MDKMNQNILKKLAEDGRISWSALGQEVHLSSQAVAVRVQQMLEEGVFDGFTIRQQHLPRYFITVFMNHNRFDEFEAFIKAEPMVESADKTNGEGCYHVVVVADSTAMLDAFLSRLGVHCRYRVAQSIRRL